jgi:predicted acetyltransferase
MNIELFRVEENDSHLKAIFPLYVSEMVKYLDQSEDKNKSIDAEHILLNYWSQSPRWPYLIIVDKVVAGFCMLRHYPGEFETVDVDQYYVANSFRRRGVGVNSLAMLTKMHPGKWLIRVLKTNEAAFKFWVSAVESCIGNNFDYRKEKKDNMCFIRFNTKNN